VGHTHTNTTEPRFVCVLCVFVFWYLVSGIGQGRLGFQRLQRHRSDFVLSSITVFSSAARAVVSAFTRRYIGFASPPFERGNRESEDGQRGQY
jgi:hypothetical protein